MSTPATAAGALVRLSDTIDARDWDALPALLADDFTAHYVHTGERFDRAGFVALNRDYPGAWRFVREEVVDAGARAVLRARVSPADPAAGEAHEVHYVASFAGVDEAGLLSELVEVWAEVTAPPQGDRRPVGS